MVIAVIKELEKADRLYYDGANSKITDADYDALRRRARKEYPKHAYFKRIGAPVPGASKAKHEMPMGSLDNVRNRAEFLAWMKSAGYPSTTKLAMSHKLDGSSVELIYHKGGFVRGITRGDGKVGEDITRNVLRSKSVPLAINDRKITSVRAEAILAKEDWKRKLSKTTENPRNAAAGILRRKDGVNANLLHYYAFDVFSDNSHYVSTEEIAMKILESCQFEIPWYDIVYLNDAWYLFEEQEEDRDNLGYEIDGIVVKLNDRVAARKMGESNMRPRSARALKFTPRGAPTTFIGVVWQIGGSGVITPVAKVKPVRVGGTTIRNVTLHNLDEIERLGLRIGDEVEVIRAGDVIPKIMGVLTSAKKGKDIEYPVACPACSSPTEREGVNLLCTNKTDCVGVRKRRVLSWIKKRDILYVGEGIIEAAFEDWPKFDIIALYTNTEDVWEKLSVGNGRLGVKRAAQICAEIEESRKVSLGDFFGSLGIPLCGRSMMNKLVEGMEFECVGDLFLSLLAGKQLSRFSGNVEGFGDARTDALLEWLADNRDFVESLEEHMEFSQPSKSKSEGALSGKNICFTGKSAIPRKTLQKMAAANGATVKSSATNDLNILVCADLESVSSKARKARDRGVELITEGEFLDRVGYED